jgi:hypothetical protein
MLKNPIIEELVRHLQHGRQVKRIHPDFTAQPNKKVMFYFEDGSSSILQTECDHTTFMRWWRELFSFIRMAHKVQEVDEPSER